MHSHILRKLSCLQDHPPLLSPCTHSERPIYAFEASEPSFRSTERIVHFQCAPTFQLADLSVAHSKEAVHSAYLLSAAAVSLPLSGALPFLFFLFAVNLPLSKTLKIFAWFLTQSLNGLLSVSYLFISVQEMLASISCNMFTFVLKSFAGCCGCFTGMAVAITMKHYDGSTQKYSKKRVQCAPVSALSRHKERQQHRHSWRSSGGSAYHSFILAASVVDTGCFGDLLFCTKWRLAPPSHYPSFTIIMNICSLLSCRFFSFGYSVSGPAVGYGKDWLLPRSHDSELGVVIALSGVVPSCLVSV